MISPDDTLALLAALAGIVAAAVIAEKTRIGALFAAPGLILAFAIAASQLDLIPTAAPLYDAVWTYFVPMAVALFLFKANLVTIFREGGRVLIAFLSGVAGVLAGALIGAATLDLGPEGPALAAVFTATYTGGSLNFAAVAEAIDFKDASLLTTALTIDNVLGIGYILLINLMGGWALLRRFFGWHADALFAGEATATDNGERSATILDFLSAIAIAAAVCSVSYLVAEKLSIPGYSMLFITVLTVVLVVVFPRFFGEMRGEDMIALVFMYLFFAMMGAGGDVSAMLTAAPDIFLFVLLIFLFHFVFLVVCARIFKLNYAEMLTASLACIAGPPVAAAIAILFKWRSLVVPGILTGIFGYVVGNFLGVGMHALLGATP